jgi:outer membrane protein assembly factor BamB
MLHKKHKEKNKMNMMQNKTKLSVTTFFLILTITATLIALPATNAHSPPWSIKTYAFIAVEPSPIGVGQTAYVTFGIDKVPMTVSRAYGDRWTNFTITVTKPNGNIETLTGFTADDTGFSATTYTPDMVGNYTFVLDFGGQTLTGANPNPVTGTVNPEYVGDYYEPSTSSTILEVQEEQVGTLPFNPLPASYWERPINMMNTNWNTISGNWLGLMALTNGGWGYNCATNFNPYSTAPNTPHIVWAKSFAPGGLIGGEYGDTADSNFYSTGQYEAKFKAVILNGILYYTSMPGASTYTQGTVAVDVRTGEELWTKPMNGTLRCGQVYDYTSPNQFGGLAYLWSVSGTTWSMYDAMTGNWILDITGGGPNTWIVSSETDGSLLVYYVNSTVASSPTLNMWNSSRAILANASNTWQWRPIVGSKIPWQYGIEWSKPIATNISDVAISPVMNIGFISSNVVLLYSQPTGHWTNYQIEAGYSAIDGGQKWIANRTLTPWTYNSGDYQSISGGNGLYYIYCGETQQFTCFSLSTGEKVWGPSESLKVEGDSGIWGYFATCVRGYVAYGTLFWSDFSGHLFALNATTGERLWTWYAGDAEYNTVYGSWPVKNVDVIADGKVYLVGGHVYNPPLHRGEHLYCINVTTGDLIWKDLSFTNTNAASMYIAEGYLLASNAYDNRIYCYGKGLSATTVSASPKVSVYGNSVLIEGTVTDQSPGQTCLGIPAKGTPAIADVSQEEWMEYLYQQQPMPTNATGVPVTLSVLDANGNYREIGTTTSGPDGLFSYTWNPDIAGKYTLYASFAGSESYFASNAVTAFQVDEPAATVEPTASPQSIADMYFVPATIGIILAIIIVGILMVLLLKKRP